MSSRPPAREHRPGLDPLADPRAPQLPADSPYATPPPAAGWKESVVTASGLNLLAGIWLIIAPFVLGYSSRDPVWNDVIFGAIVAVFALIRILGAYRASFLSWINALIGVWIFAAAFWLDGSGTAAANDIILGVIVFVLAVISAGASDDAAMAGRPWYRRQW